MSDQNSEKLNPRQQEQAAKKERLEQALRENLRKRKSLQRGRGEAAPDAIKNKNRMTD